MARRLATLIVFTMVLVACSGATGTRAPEVGALDTACAEIFCLSYPRGWLAEAGGTFVTLRWPDDDAVLGSAGTVDLDALVAAGGGTTTATPERAVEAFWQLLGEGQAASMESLAVRPDGSVWSQGTLEGGRLWHALIPLGGNEAIGVEVRAPNTSWESHADAIRSGVTP